MDADAIISKLFQRVVAGESAHAYTISNWDKAKSSLTGDRVRLRDEHAQPLIDAGLLYKTESGSIYYGLTPAGIRRGMELVPYTPLDVGKLVEWALEARMFVPRKELKGKTAIPFKSAPGESRLVLVLGENAAGKSLFRRMIRFGTHIGREARMGEPAIPRGEFPVHECVHLSMEARASGGFSSSMIYGVEAYHSTGENSARTILTSIKTVSGRDHTTVLYWDEPDIGMSNRAAAGAGIAIREFIERMPVESPLVEAVFLTSHNPALIRHLAPLKPHYVYLGDAQGPATLGEWFDRQENPEPLLPQDLLDLSRARFLDIQKVLDKTKE